MKKTIFLVTGALIIGVGLYYYFKAPVTETPVGAICTREAKLCPDGTYVSRTGPNCEFTPCGTTTEKVVQKPIVDTTKTVLGNSVEKRDITAYHFGTGANEVLFVGGVFCGDGFDECGLGWNRGCFAQSAAADNTF